MGSFMKMMRLVLGDGCATNSEDPKNIEGPWT